MHDKYAYSTVYFVGLFKIRLINSKRNLENKQ